MSSIDFARAKAIADAVLYEGYALYPYRGSALKNRYRWQFGVVFPHAYATVSGESSALGCECFLEGDQQTTLQVQGRFLQVERRQVESLTSEGQYEPAAEIRIGDTIYLTWDEGIEQVVESAVQLADLLSQSAGVRFTLPRKETVEILRTPNGEMVGRIVRRSEELAGLLSLRAELVSDRVFRLALHVENQTEWPLGTNASRSEAIRYAFVGLHILLGTTNGAFLSAIAPEAGAHELPPLRQYGLWPVLVGEPGDHAILLATPIILEDYPQVAPESPRLFYDATEIDELLILRTLPLTNEEKREARATDPRIAALLSELEALPPQTLARLHGAIRSLVRHSSASRQKFYPGQRVVLRPRSGQGDIHDLWLAGRVAVIEEMRTDVDGVTYAGVTLVDDPDADLLRQWGRFWYFRLDELEPFGEGAS